jgi:hypothetical protein
VVSEVSTGRRYPSLAFFLYNLTTINGRAGNKKALPTCWEDLKRYAYLL